MRVRSAMPTVPPPCICENWGVPASSVASVFITPAKGNFGGGIANDRVTGPCPDPGSARLILCPEKHGCAFFTFLTAVGCPAAIQKPLQARGSAARPETTTTGAPAIPACRQPTGALPNQMPWPEPETGPASQSPSTPRGPWFYEAAAFIASYISSCE